MFWKMSLLLISFFTLSHLHAADCPNLEGTYLCGFDGRPSSSTIDITQEQNEEGFMVYKLFSGEIVADGVERDVSTLNFTNSPFEVAIRGHYKASCREGGLEFFMEGDTPEPFTSSTLALSVTMILAPVEKEDGSLLLEGKFFIEGRIHHKDAPKPFAGVELGVSLSEEGTMLACKKTSPAL